MKIDDRIIKCSKCDGFVKQLNDEELTSLANNPYAFVDIKCVKCDPYVLNGCHTNA